MKTNRRFLLAAIFGFAITFTFSCSSDDGGGGGNNSGCGSENNGICWSLSNEENRCQNGIAEFEIEGVWYQRAEYLRQNGWMPCGNLLYHPDSEFRCQSGVLELKCPNKTDGVWYNPATHLCSLSWDEGNINYTIKTYEQAGYQRCGR